MHIRCPAGRHLVAAALALAPIAALAQVATRPPVGNAMENSSPSTDRLADTTGTAATNGNTTTDQAADPTADTNSVDATTSDPSGNSAANTADDAPPKG